MRWVVLFLSAFFALPSFSQLNIQPEIHAIKVEEPGKFKASIAFPFFKGDTPVVVFANETLNQRAQKLFDEFRKSLGPRGGNEALTTASISYYTTQIITGVMTSYSFTGGAHGNTFALPYNFAMVGGVPKELRFADVFKPGTSDEVSMAVLGKLHGLERASYLADGSVSSMTSAQLNRFVITKDGVKFFFNRYELAPYAAGDFNVTLLYSEIEHLVQPSGPTSLIPK
jgi:hypothetical protein